MGDHPGKLSRQNSEAKLVRQNSDAKLNVSTSAGTNNDETAATVRAGNRKRGASESKNETGKTSAAVPTSGRQKKRTKAGSPNGANS